MRLEKLRQYIELGEEIKFTFKGKNYFITYTYDDNDNHIIFYEYYQKELEVESVDVLLESFYKGYSIKEMILSLRDEDVWIY